MYPCLVLTPWFSPHLICPWQVAISDSYTGKIDVLEQYEEVARSPSVEIRFPAVARLAKPMVRTKKDVKFSRANVYTRDGHRCQYCGIVPNTSAGLNYDHVIPRSKGGKTTWDNIVACCVVCNRKKGDRTPKQAGMRLLRIPQRPTSLPVSSPIILPREIPSLWVPYLGDRLARISA